MTHFSSKRRERNRLKFSAMGKRSQEIQRARREADITPEYLAELASAQPCGKGDPVGSMEFRNLLTGRVLRWTVLRGERINQVRLRSPSGKTGPSISKTRLMSAMRRCLPF